VDAASADGVVGAAAGVVQIVSSVNLTPCTSTGSFKSQLLIAI
jgi:hypothetical protein